jgi:hypothetical protein
MLTPLTRGLAALTAAVLGASLITAPGAQAAGPEELLKGLERFQGGVAETTRSLSVAPQVGWDAGLESLRPPSAPWYRLWDMKVAWRDVNPAPGVFDWSILDRRVAQVESWGGRPLLVLGLTPQWAAQDPNAGDPRWGAGSASPPSTLGMWGAYVSAISQRYGSRIGGYELWNEANLRTFWTGSAAELAEMAGLAHRIIKDSSPNAVVLAPSVTTRLSSGARFSAAFLDAFVGKSETPFDAWAIHTYPAGNAGVSFDGSCNADPESGETPQDCINGASPKLAAQQRANDVRQWQQTVVSVVGAASPLLDLPIWDTEINYGLAGPGIIPGVDWSDLQGAFLMRYTSADSAELGIDNTFWYEFTATPFSLLGVQMTPSTQQTLSAWGVSSSTRSGTEYQLPVIDGCRYVVRMICPNTDLKNADLSDSSMWRSNFNGSDLYRVNLSGSSFRDSTAENTRFFEANLTDLDGRGSTFYRSNMMRVVAKNADFRGADLTGVDFRKADLRGVDFRNAALANVDFRDADLSGADLRGAQTKAANFKRAKTKGMLR